MNRPEHHRKSSADMIAPANDTLPRFDADHVELERQVRELQRQLAENSRETRENTEFTVKAKTAAAVTLTIIGIVLAVASLLVSFWK